MKPVSRLIPAGLMLVMTLILALPLAAQQASTRPTSDTVAIIRISGQIEESVDPLAIFGPETESLRKLTARIDSAAKNSRVDGLIVEITDPTMGPAQAVELHDALRRFRESGKPLITMLDEGDLWDYLAASAGDEVVISPVGSLDIFGLAAHLYFFEPLLTKIGMSAQVVATGDFKTAFEPFTRPDMSEGTRVQITALIEGFGKYLVESVAKNRGMEIEEARRALWSGPYSSKKALEAGLVTQAAYFNDFRESYAAEHGVRYIEDYEESVESSKQAPSLFSLFSGLSGGESRRAGRGNRIAVVYAVGPIVSGRAERNPFYFEQVIASEDFIELIDEALEGGNTRALVLRVDSPGGSAIASDRIWRHLESVQERGIPVVVSMGNVAASGGYYISMGADRIVVEPTTITGSIGVIGGRFVVGGTYGKLGVNQQMITVGPNAGILDETRPWNSAELEIIEGIIGDFYEEFVRKAAAGRGMEFDAMNDLAGGRVWSGIDAVERGLADEFGGLDDAIEIARKLGNAPGAPISVFPEEKTFFEYLNEALAGGMMMKATSSHSTSFGVMAETLKELLPGRQIEVFETTLKLLGGKPYSVLMYEPAGFEIR